MKSSAPTPAMTAAGILHYQAFLPAHFHAAILAGWTHGDYRINWQRPAWPRISISGWGRSQTCQWFQPSWNASQPLISHKYQKEAAEFSVGLPWNVCLTMNTHKLSEQLHQDDESCGGRAVPGQPIGISYWYPAESPCGQLCLSP